MHGMHLIETTSTRTGGSTNFRHGRKQRVEWQNHRAAFVTEYRTPKKQRSFSTVRDKLNEAKRWTYRAHSRDDSYTSVWPVLVLLEYRQDTLFSLDFPSRFPPSFRVPRRITVLFILFRRVRLQRGPKKSFVESKFKNFNGKAKQQKKSSGKPLTPVISWILPSTTTWSTTTFREGKPGEKRN